MRQLPLSRTRHRAERPASGCRSRSPRLAATRLATALVVAGGLLAASATAASAYSIAWHSPVHLTSASGGFTAVSCPAATECVAVDATGEVVWSKHPTTRSWGKAMIDRSGGGLTGVSCPLKSFCVAVDADGRYMYSKNPTGGAKRWSTPARIDAVTSPGGGYVGLAGVSCPSTTLCVAVDNAANGNVFVTTNPAGGASTWRRATIASGQQLTGISCPSTKLCVASGTELYYATSVRGIAANWHAAGAAFGAGVLSAIGCTTGTSTCVSVGYNSTLPGFATASSTASSTAWQTSAVETYPAGYTEGLLDGVACPHGNFCIAVDGNDNAFTTNTPVRGNWSGPTAVRPGSLSTSSVISCSVLICLVADSRGIVVSGSVRR